MARLLLNQRMLQARESSNAEFYSVVSSHLKKERSDAVQSIIHAPFLLGDLSLLTIWEFVGGFLFQKN